ncbi:hypothetical protein Sste5346_008026 [Sporothrix stenoceras]|uniref:Uncharacterized protein n=1 Tax=Sporothrix stenoceras TaxID=5173 RepID=A0ABR3YSB7_9PEZI
MRFNWLTVLLALALGQLGGAEPTVDALPKTKSLELSSPKGSPVSAGELAPTSECKDEVDPLPQSLNGMFTGNAAMDFVIEGSGLAHGVCTLVNHYQHSDHPCLAYSTVVASTIAAIISIATNARSGFAGVGTSNRRALLLRGADSGLGSAYSTALLDAVTEQLLSQGFIVGNSEVRTLSRRSGSGSNTTSFSSYSSPTAATDSVTAAFVIHDVVHPNLTITPADFHFTSYADGTETVLVKHRLADHAQNNSNSNNRTTVAGRSTQVSAQPQHDGPGFKYNYRLDVLADEARGQDISGIANMIGSAVGNHWGWEAENAAMDQWIGAIGIDYILLRALGLGVRIISEIDGFGEDYEDIGICGNMGDRIHDELR